MKLSWIFFILLLVFVAVFSVQNADPITVRFLFWEITMSAALIIQLAALLGGLVGLSAGVWSRHARDKAAKEPGELMLTTTPDSREATLVTPVFPHSPSEPPTPGHAVAAPEFRRSRDGDYSGGVPGQ